MTDKATTPVQVPTDWSVFGQRVLAAAIAGATAVASTLHIAVEDFTLSELKAWAFAIGAGAFTGAITAVKGLIGQGRGSNPADPNLK